MGLFDSERIHQIEILRREGRDLVGERRLGRKPCQTRSSAMASIGLSEPHDIAAIRFGMAAHAVKQRLALPPSGSMTLVL